MDIHAAMKAPSRHIYGKVYITYTDPLAETSTPEVTVNTEAYNSQKQQIVDGTLASDNLFFTLYDNNLSGDYHPSDENSQVGWTSGTVSKADGSFDTPPQLMLTFASKPAADFVVYFDDKHGCVGEDFTVSFVDIHGASKEFHVTGNTLSAARVPIDETLIDTISVTITINKVSKPYFPAVVLDAPVTSTFLYKGYQDASDLISIDLLEELTYNDDVEALGGVSANEVTVVLDNSGKYFNINNTASPVARQLRRNRKIEPYLGTDLGDGEITWYKLGTFWSYSWDVPFDSLTASVIGFDTLGLLDTTHFINHSVVMDKSIGFLADGILEDAKSMLPSLEWYIAPELYDVIIPYAWFEPNSHTAALRKLSMAYPLHVYCTRAGTIRIEPQKLHLDNYIDTWSDDTNVISKTYSSLYTVLPNVINVTAVSPTVVDDYELVNDKQVYTIEGTEHIILNFNKPRVGDFNVSISGSGSLTYTYIAYSWGIDITFSGNGTVTGIVCTGQALDVTNTTVYTRRNQESILSNGVITRNVSADFIQTSEIANTIIDRLFELASNDIYDVEVTYRGDIALTINDPILLLDGIAPDNRYNIKRHQLYWDGSLSGTADLNT